MASSSYSSRLSRNQDGRVGVFHRGLSTNVIKPSGVPASAAALVARNVPRPVNTSSLRKENGGQDVTAVLVNRSGGKKDVWGSVKTPAPAVGPAAGPTPAVSSALASDVTPSKSDAIRNQVKTVQTQRPPVPPVTTNPNTPWALHPPAITRTSPGLGSAPNATISDSATQNLSKESTQQEGRMSLQVDRSQSPTKDRVHRNSFSPVLSADDHRNFGRSESDGHGRFDRGGGFYNRRHLSTREDRAYERSPYSRDTQEEGKDYFNRDFHNRRYDVPRSGNHEHYHHDRQGHGHNRGGYDRERPFTSSYENHYNSSRFDERNFRSDDKPWGGAIHKADGGRNSTQHLGYDWRDKSHVDPNRKMQFQTRDSNKALYHGHFDRYKREHGERDLENSTAEEVSFDQGLSSFLPDCNVTTNVSSQHNSNSSSVSSHSQPCDDHKSQESAEDYRAEQSGIENNVASEPTVIHRPDQLSGEAFGDSQDRSSEASSGQVITENSGSKLTQSHNHDSVAPSHQTESASPVQGFSAPDDSKTKQVLREDVHEHTPHLMFEESNDLKSAIEQRRHEVAMEQQQNVLRHVKASRSSKKPRSSNDSKKLKDTGDTEIVAKKDVENKDENLAPLDTLIFNAEVQAIHSEARKPGGPRTRGVLFKRLPDGTLINADLTEDEIAKREERRQKKMNSRTLNKPKPVFRERNAQPDTAALCSDVKKTEATESKLVEVTSTSAKPTGTVSTKKLVVPAGPTVSAWKAGPPPGMIKVSHEVSRYDTPTVFAEKDGFPGLKPSNILSSNMNDAHDGTSSWTSLNTGTKPENNDDIPKYAAVGPIMSSWGSAFANGSVMSKDYQYRSFESSREQWAGATPPRETDHDGSDDDVAALTDADNAVPKDLLLSAPGSVDGNNSATKADSVGAKAADGQVGAQRKKTKGSGKRTLRMQRPRNGDPAPYRRKKKFSLRKKSMKAFVSKEESNSTSKEESKSAPKEESKSAPKEETNSTPKEETNSTPKEETNSTPQIRSSNRRFSRKPRIAFRVPDTKTENVAGMRPASKKKIPRRPRAAVSSNSALSTSIDSHTKRKSPKGRGPNVRRISSAVQGTSETVASSGK